MAKLNTQSRFYPWICWGVAAVVYFFQYGLLILPTAMVHQLSDGLQLDANQLGILSSAFFYTYVLIQIPVGLLFDRYGTRRLLFFAATLLAAGSIMLALAPNFWWGFWARLLMGFGAGFTFVGAVYLGKTWFPMTMFTFIVGLTEAMSGFGEISLPALFAVLKKIQHWRIVLVEIGVIIFLLAIMILIFVRDQAEVSKVKSASRLWVDLRRVIKIPQVWWLALFSGFAFTHFTVLADLWAVTFIRMEHQISTFQAILENSFVILGFTLGCLFIGYVAKVHSERLIVLVSAIVILLLGVTIMYGRWHFMGLIIMKFILGCATASSILPFNMVKRYVPSASYGVASGLINMFFSGIGVLIMPIVSFIFEYTNYYINLAVIPVVASSFMSVVVAVVIFRLCPPGAQVAEIH